MSDEMEALDYARGVVAVLNSLYGIDAGDKLASGRLTAAQSRVLVTIVRRIDFVPSAVGVRRARCQVTVFWLASLSG